MGTTQQTLAQMIRAKYPGAYDDIDDATLENQVLQKYPQYGDLPRTQAQAKPSFMQKLGEAAEKSNYGAGEFGSKDASHQLLDEGYQDIKAGNYQQGAHKLITGAMQFLKPAAPLAGVGGMVGGFAGGYAGQKLGEQVGPSVGLTPELGGDIGGLLGGAGGGAAGAYRGDIVNAAKGAANNILRDPLTGKLTVTPEPIAERILRTPEEAQNISAKMTTSRKVLGPDLPPGYETPEGQSVPIRQSPYFDPQAYKAGRQGGVQSNPFPQNSSASARPSIIQDPNSPPPAINRTYVSYDRGLLVQLARNGDRNALLELLRNPGGIDVSQAVPNSRYLLEQGAPANVYGGRLSDLSRAK